MILNLILLGLLIAASIAFWRLMVGPTVPDRIVAAGTLSIILTNTLVVLSLLFRNSVFLDVALVFALLAFVDILIMAKYFEHGELHK